MSYIDILVKDHHWSLMCVAARYTYESKGEVILALAHSEHHVYELMDAFSGGGEMGSDSDNIFHEIPDYPIVRAVTFSRAIEALESKLESLGSAKLHDSEWRTDMALRVQEHIRKVYRRVE